MAGVPIVAVSGHHPDDLEGGIAAFDRYLVKPVYPDGPRRLLQNIRPDDRSAEPLAACPANRVG